MEHTIPYTVIINGTAHHNALTIDASQPDLVEAGHESPESVEALIIKKIRQHTHKLGYESEDVEINELRVWAISEIIFDDYRHIQQQYHFGSCVSPNDEDYS